MGKKSSSDEPTPYSDHDEGIIESALDRAFNDYGGEAPSGIRVRAQVEWAGVVDRANGGVRRTRLDGLDLGKVKKQLDRTREARDRAGQARPAQSYQAKGWHAQLRKLTEHSRGSDAADKAGLSPSARTLREWLSESREPSKANQERIARAYEALRHDRVDRATAEYERHRHELVERLSESLRDRYGVEIRLRDIDDFDLE